MKIFVLNSGSSSIKYKLYDVVNNDYISLASGIAERIGIDGSFIKHTPLNKARIQKDLVLKNHKDAINAVINLLTDKECGVLKDISEIGGVGHRVVHGGEDFAASVLIDDKVLKAIEDNIKLAPLHNPANLLGINAVKALLPEISQVAVFDTAIHQTMPRKAYLYPIPLEQYHKYKIRRYGFHGTSHGYVAKKASEILGRSFAELKIITCHIGNGASITAFDKGKSVDTSMGFTPLAGLMMGTRSGDIDPYIALHMVKEQKMSSDEANNVLNKQSGVLAISGHSDMREVEDGYFAKNPQDVEALEMYAYNIVKYIGAYIAAMNGVDAIVWTAGVGENCAILRELVLNHFTYIGLNLDQKANNTRGEVVINEENSKVSALVIPTDEEFVIANDTISLIKSKLDN